MKFWDSSAIVPLFIDEPATARMMAIAQRDPAMLVWWGSAVECASALVRRAREAGAPEQVISAALSRLLTLRDAWTEVEPSERVRENAIRFLRVHALRAADALQIAAAFTAADGRLGGLEFVTLDDRLADAAGKEGFSAWRGA